MSDEKKLSGRAVAKGWRIAHFLGLNEGGNRRVLRTGSVHYLLEHVGGAPIDGGGRADTDADEGERHVLAPDLRLEGRRTVQTLRDAV